MTNFIASSIVAILGICIGIWIHNATSSDKYRDMKTQYEQCIRDLERTRDYWHDEYKIMLEDRNEWKQKAMRDDVSDAFAAYYKLEFYEKLVDKLLGNRTEQSDEVILMDGKTYMIRSYELDHTPGEADTLMLECVKLDIPG